MLWSVIIDILIALVVILFWPVLFPLSSPRSSYLPDETQEAVHLSLPEQPDSASAEPSSSPAAQRAAGAWMPSTEPGRAMLPSASVLPSTQRFQPGQGKKNTEIWVCLDKILTLLSKLSNVQFKKEKQGKEGESKMITTKRKIKQRTFGLQKASKQRRTKFNKRCSWGESPH